MFYIKLVRTRHVERFAYNNIVDATSDVSQVVAVLDSVQVGQKSSNSIRQGAYLLPTNCD